MAGFVKGTDWNWDFQFHIDTPNVSAEIREATGNRRVVTFQLDGDELDAALWGLENYKKGE